MVADTLLNLILRGVYVLFGVGAVLAIIRWLVAATRERREQWAQRIALGMVLLALVYAFGHARLLWSRDNIEAGRIEYARFGDPRLAELNRAEVRGWILDCSGRDEHALARYAVRQGEVSASTPGRGRRQPRGRRRQRRRARLHRRAPLHQGLRRAAELRRAAASCTRPARHAAHPLRPRHAGGPPPARADAAPGDGDRAGRAQRRADRLRRHRHGLAGALRDQALRPPRLRLQARPLRALVGRGAPRRAHALPVGDQGQRPRARHPQLREPRIRLARGAARRCWWSPATRRRS